MKKATLLIIFFTASMSSLFGLEIKSVVRDFHDGNLFSYKTHIIGKPNSNKFVYYADDDESNSPEYFSIKLKSRNSEKGKIVTIRFTFTTKNDPTKSYFKNQDIRISKRTQEAVFTFDRSFLSEYGKIEYWKAEIWDHDKLIDSKVISDITYPHKKSNELAPLA